MKIKEEECAELKEKIKLMQVKQLEKERKLNKDINSLKSEKESRKGFMNYLMEFQTKFGNGAVLLKGTMFYCRNSSDKFLKITGKFDSWNFMEFFHG